MSSPGISFVLAAFNVADFIGETLDSLVAAACADDEIIVVNDGSTDATPDIVRRHPGSASGLVRLSEQANQGLAATRTVGLRLATRPYVLFFDGDDILSSSAIAEARKALAARQPDVLLLDFAYWWDETPVKLQPVARGFPPRLAVSDPVRAFIQSCDDSIFCQWGRIVRRDLLDRLFPDCCPSWCFYEDLAATPYIMAAARSIYYLPVCAVQYRQRARAMTTKRSVAQCENLVRCAIFAGRAQQSLPPSEAISDAALRLLARKLVEAVRNFRDTDGSAAELHERIIVPAMTRFGKQLPRIAGQLRSSNRPGDAGVARHLRSMGRSPRLYSHIRVALRALKRRKGIDSP